MEDMAVVITTRRIGVTGVKIRSVTLTDAAAARHIQNLKVQINIMPASTAVKITKRKALS